MTVRKFRASASVFWQIIESNEDEVEYEIELDDEGDPFTDEEIETLLGDEIYYIFKQNNSVDELEVDDIEWKEV